MKLKQAKRADPAPVRCLVSRAAGDCRTCGAYVDGNLHMPNWAFGWYCAQCCPACAGKPVRASEIRPVATRLEARQRPARRRKAPQHHPRPTNAPRGCNRKKT